MKKIVGILCLSVSVLSYASEAPKEPSKNIPVAVTGAVAGATLAYICPPVGIPALILSEKGWIILGGFAGAEAAHQYVTNRPLFYSHKKPVIIENKNNEK